MPFSQQGDFAMKKTKLGMEQIAFTLGRSETGTKVAEVCRQPGYLRGYFQQLEKKYGLNWRQ